MSIQIVVFQLDKEEYAVEIASIESIIKLQTITKLPHAPEFVVGVTNLRGNIVPVIDLKKKLILPEFTATDASRIIVAIQKDSKVGMIVDSVNQVIEIGDETIEPAPSMSTSVDVKYIKGIIKIDKELIILLDIETVLS